MYALILTQAYANSSGHMFSRDCFQSMSVSVCGCMCGCPDYIYYYSH